MFVLIINRPKIKISQTMVAYQNDRIEMFIMNIKTTLDNDALLVQISLMIISD